MKSAPAILALVLCACTTQSATETETPQGQTMTLPTSRERTYGSNEPVRSTDLNVLQDAIIGSKTPSETYWQPVVLEGMYDHNVGIAATANAKEAGVKVTANIGQWSNRIIPGLRPGDRITGLRAVMRGTSGAASTCSVNIIRGSAALYAGGAGGNLNLNWQITNNAILTAGYNEYSVDVSTLPGAGGLYHVVAAGYFYYWQFEGAQAGAVNEEFIAVAITKDRL